MLDEIIEILTRLNGSGGNSVAAPGDLSSVRVAFRMGRCAQVSDYHREEMKWALWIPLL